jgi:hypothetical protein
MYELMFTLFNIIVLDMPDGMAYIADERQQWLRLFAWSVWYVGASANIMDKADISRVSSSNGRIET